MNFIAIGNRNVQLWNEWGGVDAKIAWLSRINQREIIILIKKMLTDSNKNPSLLMQLSELLHKNVNNFICCV